MLLYSIVKRVEPSIGHKQLLLTCFLSYGINIYLYILRYKIMNHNTNHCDISETSSQYMVFIINLFYIHSLYMSELATKPSQE